MLTRNFRVRVVASGVGNKNWIVRLAVSGAFLASAVGSMAQTHELKLIPANVHWGYLDARQKPVLRVASGETVRLEAMVSGGIERLKQAGASDGEIPNSLKEVEKSRPEGSPGGSG